MTAALNSTLAQHQASPVVPGFPQKRCQVVIPEKKVTCLHRIFHLIKLLAATVLFGIGLTGLACLHSGIALALPFLIPLLVGLVVTFIAVVLAIQNSVPKHMLKESRAVMNEAQILRKVNEELRSHSEELDVVRELLDALNTEMKSHQYRGEDAVEAFKQKLDGLKGHGKGAEQGYRSLVNLASSLEKAFIKLGVRRVEEKVKSVRTEINKIRKLIDVKNEFMGALDRREFEGILDRLVANAQQTAKGVRVLGQWVSYLEQTHLNLAQASASILDRCNDGWRAEEEDIEDFRFDTPLESVSHGYTQTKSTTSSEELSAGEDEQQTEPEVAVPERSHPPVGMDVIPPIEAELARASVSIESDVEIYTLCSPVSEV